MPGYILSEQKDIALVGTPQAGGTPIVRFQDDGNGNVETTEGILIPVQDGKTSFGEMVTLTPDKEHKPFYKVNSIAGTAVKLLHKGPALVNSESFMEGWDRIFGTIKPDESLN